MLHAFLKLFKLFNTRFFLKLDIKIFFFLYVVLGFLVNYFYSIYYLEKYPLMIDINGNYLISNIGFNFTDIILNLQSSQGIKAEYYGINYYASRMPLLPFSLFLIHSCITKNFIFIHLIKNIFFFIIIFILVYNFVKKNFKKSLINILTFLFIFLIFYVPHNLTISLSTNFEEGLLNYFIIILFLILLDNKIKFRNISIGVVLSFIFFLKSSMFYLVAVISIAYFFIEKKNSYLPIFFFLISSLLWGFYSYKYTNYFAFGPKNTSFNSIVLSTAYHSDFIKSYPRLSPDIYQERTDKIIMDAMKKDKQLNDEWSIDQFIFNESKIFLINNPFDVLKSILKKISVIFWYPYKDSQWNEIDAKKLRFSNIPNKLIFIISIVVLISSLKYNRSKIDIYYILIIVSYFFPYLVGFVYSRHATSIYMIAHIYLLNFYLLKLKYERQI